MSLLFPRANWAGWTLAWIASIVMAVALIVAIVAEDPATRAFSGPVVIICAFYLGWGGALEHLERREKVSELRRQLKEEEDA